MTKAHILAEIKRTAADNGGEALGWRRFETETGIKLGDWSKFWARWTDAIREAGLTPKEFITAFDNAMLLDHFANLAREINRIPAWSDIKFKAHNDPSFPCEKVFRRFKSKEELLRQLVEHCRAKGGWEDVLALSAGYTPKKMPASNEEVPVQEVEFGFVYLMKSGKSYKIGMSNSVGRREYELGLQLPEPVSTVHTIRTDDPPGIEEYWHKRFAAKRKNGEWFELNASDITSFKRRKFM
jgi:hypothetical protein